MSNRELAEILYEAGKDMDWMDYEEHKEETLNEIEKRIDSDDFMREVLEGAIRVIAVENGIF